MHSQDPVFSVVIPCRNAAGTLKAALDSLQAQTFPAWEALVIDDASTDASPQIAAGFAAKDHRIRPIAGSLHTPLGAASMRNLGLEQARGQFVAFLDADDLWLPDKLRQQHQLFLAGADIVFSSYQRIGPNGQPMGHVPAAAIVTYTDALAGNPIGLLTGAYRLGRFPQARFVPRDLHEDYPFWLSLLRSGAQAQGIPAVLAQYRVSPNSLSANKLRAMAAVWSILGAEGLSPGARSAGFIRYALRSIKKRL